VALLDLDCVGGELEPDAQVSLTLTAAGLVCTEGAGSSQSWPASTQVALWRGDELVQYFRWGTNTEPSTASAVANDIGLWPSKITEVGGNSTVCTLPLPADEESIELVLNLPGQSPPDYL